MTKFKPKPRIEELVSQLFNDQKYQNLEHNHPDKSSDSQADFTFKENSELTVVEIRQYSPDSPLNLEIFHNALQQTDFIRSEFNAKKAILVVTCKLSSKAREIAKAHKEIDVWDLTEILERAEKESPDLRREFSLFLKLPNTINLFDFFEESKIVTATAEIAENPVKPDGKGGDLASKIKKISPGRDDAAKFEDICIESLKYLFEADLVGWHAQQVSSDSLTRKDLVCRIKSDNNFWNLISTSFNSRYVVFEFKNYTDKITQNEIITTERYLYPTALRNTAIIISPRGSGQSAEKIIAGAMREHGKLIMSITVDEICKLLVGKDKGEDPNAFMYDKVDEFLMSLSR